LPTQATKKPHCRGTQKLQYRIPLILRISNRSHFSVVPCLSPISAAAGITRQRRAKPTRVVVQRGRRSSSFRCSEVRITCNEVFRPRSRFGASMLREQGVERGGYGGRKLEPENSNRYVLGVLLNTAPGWRGPEFLWECEAPAEHGTRPSSPGGSHSRIQILLSPGRYLGGRLPP
jgi:hypothetical protein